MDMTIDHDPTVDAVDVTVRSGLSAYTRVVDDLRLLDYDAAGNLIGIEFLSASKGIRLAGLPLAAAGIDVAELARALRDKSLPVIDEWRVSGRGATLGAISAASGAVPAPVWQGVPHTPQQSTTPATS